MPSVCQQKHQSCSWRPLVVVDHFWVKVHLIFARKAPDGLHIQQREELMLLKAAKHESGHVEESQQGLQEQRKRAQLEEDMVSLRSQLDSLKAHEASTQGDKNSSPFKMSLSSKNSGGWYLACLCSWDINLGSLTSTMIAKHWGGDIKRWPDM